MTEKILLKDLLFNRDKIIYLSVRLQNAYPAFKANEFVQDVLDKFPSLELKARIRCVAECLKRYLPSPYEAAVDILLRSLPTVNNPNLSDGDFGDFIYAPYSDFIAMNGCNKKSLKISLSALKEITKRFSAEDAIRYFINQFPEETLQKLMEWTDCEHYHVRRLCSEGTRPKLPWAQKICISITTPVAILDKLFYDNTRFVTRSVATHMNDISKIDPELVINTLRKWLDSKKQNPEEMQYIIRHSLRTLIKQGNLKALNLLGFSNTSNLVVSKLQCQKIININSTLEFSFTIQALEDANLIIDYIIRFQNKSGKNYNKKVFKLKKIAVKKNETISISKCHKFNQFMTTRTIYPGTHEIELQINGNLYGKKQFEIVQK